MKTQTEIIGGKNPSNTGFRELINWQDLSTFHITLNLSKGFVHPTILVSSSGSAGSVGISHPRRRGRRIVSQYIDTGCYIFVPRSADLGFLGNFHGGKAFLQSCSITSFSVLRSSFIVLDAETFLKLTSSLILYLTPILGPSVSSHLHHNILWTFFFTNYCW